jgi:phage baseplate assembly protein W
MSTQRLSDRNPINRKAQTVAQRNIFTDFNLAMPIHPIKNDIVPLRDIDAIKQSVKNLVLTNFGEKVFKPEFGGNVSSYLFENVSALTALSIQEEIEIVLRNFEPRIEDTNIQVSNNIDSNAYRVTITFSIANTTYQNQEIEFQLNRTR